MKVPVPLYLRVCLHDGSYPYLKAVILPNGHVRPDYAMNAGRVVKVSNGVYQLRYKRDGKRVWEPVGTDGNVAFLRLRKKIREFEDAEAGEPKPAPAPVPAPLDKQPHAPIAATNFPPSIDTAGKADQAVPP